MYLLVVDDDEIFRCTTAFQLTTAGHHVETAVDGADALDRLSSAAGRFDVVISDWDMPNVDGPGLCRAIRDRPGGHATYVILLTGKESAQNQADGYDAGADAYLVKPCAPTDLLASLRTAELILGPALRRAG